VIRTVTGLVQSLPEYLDDTLKRIRQSPPRQTSLAFQAFAWLIAARTALRADQLCEALAISSDDTKLLMNRKPNMQLVVVACRGLIMIKPDTGAVEFFHHTIMEHLAAEPELLELARAVAANSLHYLLYDNFAAPCETLEEIQHRRHRYPLTAYLSVHWSEHLHGRFETEFEDQIIQLLLSPAILSSLQLLPPQVAFESRIIGHFSVPKPDTWWGPDKVAMSLAVHYGLRFIAKRLSATGHDVNFTIPQGPHYTPLHGAVFHADANMVEDLVVDGKAWVDPQDIWGLTPLHLAMTLPSTPPRLRIVDMLCHAGASLSQPDQDGDFGSTRCCSVCKRRRYQVSPRIQARC